MTRLIKTHVCQVSGWLALTVTPYLMSLLVLRILENLAKLLKSLTLPPMGLLL